MEKYTNIDYLEYELDLYNLKDNQRRANQEKVIEKLKVQHLKSQKDEIFEEEEGDAAAKQFNEMRETKTGFGAKGNYAQEGRLEAPDDEESDGEEDGEDGGSGIDDQDDGEDSEQSDHNF